MLQGCATDSVNKIDRLIDDWLQRVFGSAPAPCRVTWGRGSEITRTTYLESQPRIPDSLYNFQGAAPLQWWKFSVRKRVQNFTFWGKFFMLKFGPPRKSIPTETRRLMQKQGRYYKNVFSRAWQDVSKKYNRAHNSRSRSIQGHPRSLILVPIESAYVISY